MCMFYKQQQLRLDTAVLVLAHERLVKEFIPDFHKLRVL